MWNIGNMAWRIGELLDLNAQLAWMRNIGFDGAGVHASVGTPGQWRGIDPAACDDAARKRWHRALASFAYREVHAPFAIELRDETLETIPTTLAPVLAFAGDIDATVVTVHATLPPHDNAQWQQTVYGLNAMAERIPTTIALEMVDGFHLVTGWNASHLGITLDVGHMYLPVNRQRLADCGGIRNLIRNLGNTLRHLHLHDVRDETDHIELGTGIVEFDEIIAALQDIDYRHGMTLELNPDRVSPAGMQRSLAYLRNRCAKAGVR